LRATPLRRSAEAPPVRAVHLGLGSFFRAHQAWYTQQATDAESWGIAAFTGRSAELADLLSAQDGLYTMVTRGGDHDDHTIIRSLAAAYPAAAHGSWLELLASPNVHLLTITVTEAGYTRDASGGLDLADARVGRDVPALRADPRAPVVSAVARILAGLIARRQQDAGPLALVPCDNLPDNGSALTRVLYEAAAAVDETMTSWLSEQVTAVTTMVDRITPETTDADRRGVAATTGIDDLAPVVTEPFHEWVISGEFPGGRPAWESAGAVLTSDVLPYEQRKLWLLNGGHSLLAYLGALRDCRTVFDAVSDGWCRAALHEWWSLCRPYLAAGPEETDAYCAALLERFANPRIQHGLVQIAADGSQKLPVRLLPVLRHERAAGRVPEPVVMIIAAWLLHLRGGVVPVRDVQAAWLRELAQHPLARSVPELLAVLDQELIDDAELISAVRSCATEWTGS
jgi:fructuronate reductase